jgi:hypothetical protein
MSRPPWSGTSQAQQRWSGWRLESVRVDPRAGALRIGDAEREEACRALGEHFAAGRLTRAEFDERTTAAWAARTRAELGPLFTDLPAPHGDGFSRPGASGAVAAPRQPRRRFPWLAWILAVIVLHVVTGVSWVLLGLGLWLLLSWVRDWGRPRRTRPGGPHGPTGAWGHGSCGRGSWSPR